VQPTFCKHHVIGSANFYSMAQYSFIDFGLRDFLRDDNDEVIVIDVPHHEAAEDWLLTNGEDVGWTNSGVRYWNWTEEE
jgi:hypothetical protein